jgi:S-formylglutathione hydrolase FrmB
MRYTIVLAVLLAACGSAAPSLTSTFAGPEVGVTLVATRFPTITRPATSTTIPTGTPLPTITPYQTPTRAATPTFAPSWTPVPPPTPTRAPAVTQTPIPVLVVPADTSVRPISKDNCPSTHPIKGNQGSNGWIYHVPTGASYSATDPEECFATEAAAVKAGYRKAPR